MFNEATETPIKDLKPLHFPETTGDRPGLSNLSDDELLNSARNPENGDPLTVNTKTGNLVDGNSRANDPSSSITPDTTVPMRPYTPDDSMFWDQ